MTELAPDLAPQVPGAALDTPVDDDALLDAYSRTVTSVAEALLPSVASLQVWAGGGGSGRTAGSGARWC